MPRNNNLVPDHRAARERFIENLPRHMRFIVDSLDKKPEAKAAVEDITLLRGLAEQEFKLNGVDKTQSVDYSNAALAVRLGIIYGIE